MAVTWTPETRLERAQHNKSLDGFLRSANDAYCDWQIVALFYAALHLIDTYREVRGILPTDEEPNHSERWRVVASDDRFKNVKNDYRRLIDFGFQARYTPVPVNPDDVSNARQRLMKIENYLRPLILASIQQSRPNQSPQSQQPPESGQSS